ncbi:MAG TPA: NAD(P)-binding domain-containing protein, partial [Xanthobacteraceae bacterium]
ARRIGAVNCVVVAPDGSLDGQNHDAFGYIESIREAQPGWRADAGPIVVIGAGGGARAVLVSLIDQGAREIRLVNRTLARATALQSELGGPIKALPWEQREAALAGAAMLVNATSQGMAGAPPLELALDRLPARALVSDIVYIPRETPLLAAARKRGNPAVNGVGMLLHQARPAFRAWFGIMPEVTPELRAMIEATT